MKLYISGKITDTSPEKQSANLAKFDEVAGILREAGHEVFNPAELEVKGGATWEYYLARDLKWIYDNRPTLYVMSGCETSLGAKLEIEFAELIGLDIMYC